MVTFAWIGDLSHELGWFVFATGALLVLADRKVTVVSTTTVTRIPCTCPENAVDCPQHGKARYFDGGY